MNILFLDCDGVINSTIWYSNPKPATTVDEDIAPSAVKMLNYFTSMNDYDIVISSDWRIDSDCIKRLEKAGLKRVIDTTPITIFDDVPKTRKEEIQAWLNSHSEVKNYLILDDTPIEDSHYVHVNPYYGLMLDELRKLINYAQEFSRSSRCSE